MRKLDPTGKRRLSPIPLLACLMLTLAACGGSGGGGGHHNPMTFTIEGFVQLPSGQGVPQIDVDGGPLGTAITDANGHYSFGNAANGQTYTIAPMEPGFSFTPGPQQVMVNSANVGGIDFEVDGNPWSNFQPEPDFVSSYPLGDIFGTNEDFSEAFDYIRGRPLFQSLLTQFPGLDPNTPIVFPKTELLKIAGGTGVPYPMTVSLVNSLGMTISTQTVQPGLSEDFMLDWRLDGLYGVTLEVQDPNYGNLPAGSVVFWLPPYDIENQQSTGAVLLSGGGQDWSTLDVALSTSFTPWQIQSGFTQFGNVFLMFFFEEGLEVSLAAGTQGRVAIDMGEYAKFVSPCATLPNQLPSQGGWVVAVTDTGYISRPSTYYFAPGDQNEILVQRPVFQSFTTGNFDEIGIETVFGGQPGDHLGGVMNVVDPFNLTGGQPTPIRNPALPVGSNWGTMSFQSLMSDPRVIGIKFDLDLYDGQNSNIFLQRDSILVHVERMTWEK